MRGPHRVVTEELEFVDRGQPDADDGTRVGRATVPRPGVGVVAADHHLHDAVDVVDRSRHDTDAVQRLARRHQADGADQSSRRLVADDAVERRGHPARARGVGGDREGHLPQCDRQRRSRTGAAGDQLVAVHAARHGVGRPGPVQSGGELVQVGLSDVERAGVEQPLHRRCGRRRNVGVVGTRQRRRDARHVDAVLDAERHAVERESPCARPVLDLRRGGQQLFSRNGRQPGPVVAAGGDGIGYPGCRLGGRSGASRMRGEDLGHRRANRRAVRSGSHKCRLSTE